MELLEYFDEENEQYTIFSLNEEEGEIFLSKLPNKFRLCYIPKKKLQERVKI